MHYLVQTVCRYFGFVDWVEPTDVSTYDVVASQISEICVGYSPEQVSAWVQQTETNLQGYSLNPSTFKVVVAAAIAPYITV